MLFDKAEIVFTLELCNIYNESLSVFDILVALFGNTLIKTGINILENILGFLNAAAFTYDKAGNRRKGFAVNCVKIGVKRIVAQKGSPRFNRPTLSSRRFLQKSFILKEKVAEKIILILRIYFVGFVKKAS